MTKDIAEEFIEVMKTYISFWSEGDGDDKYKLEGLAFSILCMIDGVSTLFPHFIEMYEATEKGEVIKERPIIGPRMLHEMFFKEKG